MSSTQGLRIQIKMLEVQKRVLEETIRELKAIPCPTCKGIGQVG